VQHVAVTISDDLSTIYIFCLLYEEVLSAIYLYGSRDTIFSDLSLCCPKGTIVVAVIEPAIKRIDILEHDKV
jgi:hypothetical protein